MTLKKLFVIASAIPMFGVSFSAHAATLHHSSLNPSSIAHDLNDHRQAFWPVTGVMMRVNGETLYLGEYSSQGENGVIYKDAAWEVKSNGSVIGHGSGRISGRFYRWACQKFGC